MASSTICSKCGNVFGEYDRVYSPDGVVPFCHACAPVGSMSGLRDESTSAEKGSWANPVIVEDEQARRFDIFTRAARFWLTRLGILQYTVTFEQKDLEGCPADVRFNVADGLAFIRLSTDLPENTTDTDIRRSAFHEVCELMLGRSTNRLHRFYSSVEVDEITHEIIRRLENTLFLEWEGRLAKPKDKPCCP